METRINNTRKPNAMQVSNNKCDLTLRLEWGGAEITHLREIKDQIQQENNPLIRHMLETELHARVQHCVRKISTTMLEISKDKMFCTLPIEEQTKVLGWVTLANGSNFA